MQEVLKKSADNQIYDLKNESVELKEKVSQQKVHLLESKELKIKNEIQKYVDESVTLESDLKSTSDEFNAISVKLGEIKHFVFNKEEITKHEESIVGYEKALLGTQKSLNDNSFEIQKVEQQLEEIAKKFKTSSQKYDQEIKIKKDDLFMQKSLVEKKLDFDKDNLYGYINRNSVKNAKKLVTYLKDEILFSDKAFTVKIAEDSKSIFGLNVEFDEAFENKYEQSKLQKELKLIRDGIRGLNNDAIRKNNALEEEASKDTKEQNRQRTILYKQKNKVNEEKKATKKTKYLLS